MPAALAQLLAHPGAPESQQPTVLSSANGVIQVNIQTPNAAGVSHNSYRQFDVPPGGIVLNNSRTDSLSQLGGQLQGNPWLASGSARLILNEVHSSQPSQLRGFIEVAGPRSEVVIANPAGIVVNGGGFLNASGVTLSTGQPQLVAGSLDAFRVRGGTLRIEGQGLDARSTDYTRILARAAHINAGLWAQNLQLVTGTNDIQAAEPARAYIHARPATADTAPQFALDVAAIGGMYAGKIFLIGTEAGVGVRNAGVIGASAGDLVLTQEGWLHNGGEVYASGNARITAQGHIDNAGRIAAQGQTHLLARGAHSGIQSSSNSLIAAGMNREGVVTAPAALQLQAAGAAVLYGQLLAGGDLQLRGSDIDLRGSQLSARQAELHADAGAIDAAQAQLQVQGLLSAEARTRLRTDHATVHAGQLSLSAQDLSNRAGKLLQRSTGDGSDRSSSSSSGSGSGSGGGDGAAALQITLSGQLDNSAGLISGQTLRIQDRAAADANANANANANAERSLSITNTAGRLHAFQTQHILAAALGGDGQLHSHGDLHIDLNQDFQHSGELLVQRHATLRSLGTVHNQARMQAGAHLGVYAQNLHNQVDGEISAEHTTLAIADTLNNRGLIDSGNSALSGQTRLQAQTLNNLGHGRIYGDHVSLGASHLNNLPEADTGLAPAAATAPTIAARQRLDLGAAHIANAHGATLLSLGDLAIGGALDAQGHASGSARHLSNRAASIEALGDLRLHSDAIENLNHGLQWRLSEGTPGPSGTLFLTPSGTFDTAHGALLASNSEWVAENHGGYIYRRRVWVPCTETWLNTCITKQGEQVMALEHSGKGQAQRDSQSPLLSIDGLVRYQQTDYRPVLTSSAPARIASGGAMALHAGQGIVNAHSAILAGEALHIDTPQLDNQAITVNTPSTRHGTAYRWDKYDHGCGQLTRDCDYKYHAYRPSNYSAQVNTTQVLDTAVAQAYSPQAPGRNAPAQGQAPGAPRRAVVPDSGHTTSHAPLQLPRSALFQIRHQPDSRYLVETDPRFTDRTAWLGSDYLQSQLALDPRATQKRLGDGFYEQQLLREQLAQLTGRRFIGDYRTEQEQYLGLMNAGLSFARAQQLRPGIALSAAQVAQLTSDIVWLQQEDIRLDDGSTTPALVPRLYAAVRAGDLQPSGALLSADKLAIQSHAALTNSGSILGRKTVHIEAGNIHNLLGQVGGADVALLATQDIDNVGGTLSAQQRLQVAAAGDLRVRSTQQSTAGDAGAYRWGQSGVDRLARLVLSGEGTLQAAAGNTLHLTAAHVHSAGDAQLSAGGALVLDTLQHSQQHSFDADNADHHLRTRQTSELGTQLRAQRNLQIRTDANLYARAADLRAQGAVDIAAQGSIVLDAGQSQSHFDEAHSSSSTGVLSSTSTRTRTQASAANAQVTTVQGQSVKVLAGQHLVSVGTEITGLDSLYLEGMDSSSFYAADNTWQSTTTRTQSTSGLVGSILNASQEEIKATSHSAHNTSLGTRLLSNKKVHINVGNSAHLQGSTVQAEQIAFTRSGPDKAGHLILGGSIDSTLVSHTEKKDSAWGLWQSQSGSGHVSQTLNQTRLHGQVSLDQALKITAQIPSTQSGTELKTQIQALAERGGQSYLGQLAERPNVQWDQVALAHKNWDYSHAGLSSAGATLLTLAVAYFTAGAGTALLGTTTATGAGTVATATAAASTTTLGGVTLASSATGLSAAGLAVNAGYSSLLAQASVAMVNNGGDVGKTLAQLGSQPQVKNLLTTMVTAGALANLDQAMGFAEGARTVSGQGGTASLGSAGTAALQAPAAAQFTQNLLKNVSNRVAGVAIHSAIQGKALDESTLSSALRDALLSTGLARGAHAIGDAATAQTGKPQDIDAFTHKVAHAVLGCAGGAAMAGHHSGCSSGAVGAVVGELSAEFAKAKQLDDAKALALARVVSAAAGILAAKGADKAADLHTAATTGANAAQNNTLYHFNGRLVARDSKNNDRLIDLRAGDLQTIAGSERALLLKEIAGFDHDAVELVLISDAWADQLPYSSSYQLSDAKDRNTLQGKTDMSYINIDDRDTRIYVETGMLTKKKDAIQNAQTLQNLVGMPVGAIVNITHEWGNDLDEYLPNGATLADALNEYTYRSLNDQGPTLIVTHSAGNNDAVKAMQLGKQLGHQYPNLSLLSLGSPISDRKMKVASSDAGVNYLGQVNDWRDPVTHPKVWVLGTGVAAVGGLVAGGAAAPSTGGGSLYAFFSAITGGAVGLGIGGGLGMHAVNQYHAMSNYFSKPKSQSIMFDWIKNQNE